MAEDFSNLRYFKKSFNQSSENIGSSKKINTQKANSRILFIITKKKSNSWIDDFHAQAQMDMMKPVYH